MAGRHAYHGTTRWAYTWLDQRVSSGLEVRSRCLAVRIQPLGAAARNAGWFLAPRPAAIVRRSVSAANVRRMRVLLKGGCGRLCGEAKIGVSNQATRDNVWTISDLPRRGLYIE